MQNRWFPVALLLLGSQSIHADDQTAAPIIVTATRTAQTADDALASVTVITHADIERAQATSVLQLLRGLPGVEVSNNGGLGKTTSVYLRGTESDQVLVLIDGVKVGSATLGTTAFENIPVDQIDHIEIVRGPRSSLYGSDAIGGVIQIFTHKGGGSTRPTLTVGAGSHYTYSGYAGVSGGGTHGWYNVSLSRLDSQGFNACNGAPYVSPSSPGGGCFTYEPDNDGYRSGSGAVHAGYQFSDGTNVDLHILRTTGFNKYDGTYSNQAHFAEQEAGSQVGFSPMDSWHASIAAGDSLDDSKDYLNGVYKDTFNTDRKSATFQNNINIGASQLVTAGVDYLNDSVDSSTVYTVSQRDDTGVFGQYQATYDQQNMQFALRNDDNQQFGHHTTGGLSWGYTFSRQLLMFTSYGTAFKAPTFNDLYYPGFGNPDLRPETSRSTELGLRGTVGRSRWSLSGYETHIIDLIAFDATYTPLNIDTSRIRGLEATAATAIAGWDLKLDATLLDPRNLSGGANNGNVLPRRARESLRVDIDRAFGKLQLGTTLFGEGKRYDDIANTVPLNAYALVSLRADYALSPSWSIGGRVGNLFNKQYETAAYYNQDGRNYFFTLRYSPAH